MNTIDIVPTFTYNFAKQMVYPNRYIICALFSIAIMYMTISKYTIYGERCSGTNYLENLITINFEIEHTNIYGHKHFFGFDQEKLTNSNDTLFICIVRKIQPWMNSFFNDKHQLQLKYIDGLTKQDQKERFLNSEILSLYDGPNIVSPRQEIITDRNLYTGKRYKNIFELRHTKNKYLIDDLPNLVKNYCFIRYEDLINDFDSTMNKMKQFGLCIKPNIIFPQNTNQYKNEPNSDFRNNPPKPVCISNCEITEHPDYNPYYENKMYKV
jgi:hypothetical protein